MIHVTDEDYQKLLLEVGKAQQRGVDAREKISALKAERDQLRKERDALLVDDRNLREIACKYEAKYEKLAAEVAGLREEWAWMEQNAVQIRWEYLESGVTLTIAKRGGQAIDFEAPTLREAMDAARKREV